MYETIFDTPGYWEMDDYGTAVETSYCFAATYFYMLQPGYRYHC